MEYKDLNDYEVLYLICDNNEDAYMCMCEKYKPLIKKLSNQFLKAYKYTDLEYEDLFQQGMIGLTEAINNYCENEKSSFFTFAYICIKREMIKLVINSLRNKNIIMNYSMSMNLSITEDNETLSDILYDEKDLTEKKLYYKLNEEYIKKLKYKLKDKYMAVYELKINGFSNKEISSLLDIPYKTVDNYLISIKTKLKNLKNNIIE